ncbi:MAG: hypothetical protein HFJ33_02220 [Clostridia bacterium]|nr:hypothetical protein [Clostridia bacterium]
MITISLFSLTDYRNRISSLYALSLAEECQKVTDCIHQAGSVVGDSLIITNPTISVPKTTCNTAIYFVCIELFGKAPVGDIRVEGNEKFFTLEE